MTMFLVLRVLHILLAAVWVGATVSTSVFLCARDQRGASRRSGHGQRHEARLLDGDDKHRRPRDVDGLVPLPPLHAAIRSSAARWADASSARAVSPASSPRSSPAASAAKRVRPSPSCSKPAHARRRRKVRAHAASRRAPAVVGHREQDHSRAHGHRGRDDERGHYEVVPVSPRSKVRSTWSLRSSFVVRVVQGPTFASLVRRRSTSMVRGVSWTLNLEDVLAASGDPL